MKKLYKQYTLTYTIIGSANANARYICTDSQAVIQLQDRTKIADYIKAQAASHAGSEYKSNKYSRIDGAGLSPL